MSARLYALSAALVALTGALLCGDSCAWAEQAPAEKAAGATSPEATIRRALSKPVKLDFAETSLIDVAKSLEKTLGVRVRLDRRALDDVGVQGDEVLTFRVSGISARSALNLMLRQLDLCWVVAHEMLLITTPEEAETMLATKVYDVADLVVRAESHGQPDFDWLMDLITSCIGPESWDSVGGPGSIAPVEAAGIKALVFSQTQDVHEEVEALLADLRNARRREPGKADGDDHSEKIEKSSSVKHEGPRSREEAIRVALAKPVSLEFNETPLHKVVEFLKEKTGVEMLIDHKALDDVGMSSDVPVTARVSEIKLTSALDYMLRAPDLTWTIAHEVLLITTSEEAETILRTKVYDVSDLPAFRDERGESVPDFQSLCDLITACVEPVSWDQVGGPGSISPFRADGIQVLVAAQTREVHEQVEALLARLREVRGKPLTEEDVADLPPLPKPSCRPNPACFPWGCFPFGSGASIPGERPSSNPAPAEPGFDSDPPAAEQTKGFF